MNNLNKDFGKLISFLCVILATLLFLNNHINLGLILSLIASASLFLSYKIPQFFSFPAKAWMGFGFILGRFLNPIFLGVLFFILISPIAILTRLFDRDELLILKNNKNKKSYWLMRQKSEEKSISFERQF
jgi:hypothetical protein